MKCNILKNMFPAVILLIMLISSTLAQPVISTLPQQPYITSEGDMNFLEFDFILSGDKGGKYYMEKITLEIQDQAGNTLERRKIEDEGMVSPFWMFPKTKVKRDKQISIFNPFYFFRNSASAELILKYSFVFTKGKETIEVATVVQPSEYSQQTNLILPVAGDLIIDSGFDHFAHHRRINTTHWGMRLLKVPNNITRYAIDFMPVNGNGKTYINDGTNLQDYVGFGKSVIAPAGGRIIEVASTYPDNEINGKLAYGTIQFIKNPRLASGNYVVIDHGNGEMSMLAHMKQGSILVKEGQQINAGEAIGQIGNSGDSTYPHLHYQLENEHSLETKTFPAKFSNVKFLNGVLVDQPVYCNTGDLIRQY